jgi:hypothetical protein
MCREAMRVAKRSNSRRGGEIVCAPNADFLYDTECLSRGESNWSDQLLANHPGTSLMALASFLGEALQGPTGK